MANDTQREAMERAFLKYLESHPSAADTAAGIGAWWLSSQPDASQRDVQSVLDRLVREGRLECVQSHNGRRLYRKHRAP